MKKKIWGTLDPFVEAGDIVGRKVANAYFLYALLQKNPFDEYHFFLSNLGESTFLRSWLEEYFPDLLAQGVFQFRNRYELHTCLMHTDYYCFHQSDCFSGSVALSQLRNRYSRSIFPITSMTHSLSYERYVQGFWQFLWYAGCARDCIVTSSVSAEKVVRRILTAIPQLYGCVFERYMQPGLATIPLGVDCSRFPGPDERWDASSPASADALLMRGRLQIKSECMFLYFGRISLQSKADLTPLLAACTRLIRSGVSSDSFVLVIAGWLVESEEFTQAYEQHAALLGIKVRWLFSPTDAERRALYAAADVFLSPVDNIQESFGLSVLEAGASGLPVLVSDLDGYRDTVEEGVTGFRIPTIGFATTSETDILASLLADNQYHLRLSQQTVVDVPIMAEQMRLLALDKELRHTLGLAARKHVYATFSWEQSVAGYLALWEELWMAPLPDFKEVQLRHAVHPLAMRFAAYFKEHFSVVADVELQKNIYVQRTVAGKALRVTSSDFFWYAGTEELLTPDLLRCLLVATRKPIRLDGLYETLLAYMHCEVAADTMESGLRASLEPIYEERAQFVVLWALKQDFIERVEVSP